MLTLGDAVRDMRSRAERGMVRLVSDDMTERERELHVKYSVPAHIDLSEESSRRTEAALAAKVEAEVADITRRYEEAMMARRGYIPFSPSKKSAAAPEEVASRARKMCDLMEQGEPGFYLYGLPGRGKTTVAELALKYWTDDGWSGDMVTEKGYMDAVRTTWDGRADIAQLHERYGTTGLLVFDELGSTEPAPWKIEELFWLFDHRWSNGLRTVVTTNRDPQSLEGFWGRAADTSALMSRLMAVCKPVPITGPDHRAAVTVVDAMPVRGAVAGEGHMSI